MTELAIVGAPEISWKRALKFSRSKEEEGIYLFDVLKWIFFFLGPHPQHIEVPMLGVESEL